MTGWTVAGAGIGDALVVAGASAVGEAGVDSVVVADDADGGAGSGGEGELHCSRVAPMAASTTTMAIRR